MADPQTPGIDAPSAARERWRAAVAGRPDAAELEGRVTPIVAELDAAGLSADEAWLIASRRVGVRYDPDVTAPPSEPTAQLLTMLGVALVAGLGSWLSKAAVAGVAEGDQRWVWAMTAGVLVVSASIAGLLWWRRRPPLGTVVGATVITFVVLWLAAALYPWDAHPNPQSPTVFLVHLVPAIWALLGASYLGRRWRSTAAWMDWVRFSGEAFLHLVLLMLGWAVLLGLTAGVLLIASLDTSITADIGAFGVGAGVIVAVWLVDARQGVLGRLAPTLAAVFTPLFTVLLIVAAVVIAATGGTPDRAALTIVDALLVIVAALVLFNVSHRTEDASVGGFDRLHLAMIVAALSVDVAMTVTMGSRLVASGGTPNQAAALGINLLLATNLAGAAWLLGGFVAGRRPLASLARWECRFVWVIGVWGAVVAITLPPLFGFR